MAKKKKEEKNETVQGILFMLKTVLFILLAVFAGGSVYFSQQVSPLYFRLTNEEPAAVVNFLKTSRDLPEFQMLIPDIKQTIASHEKDIYADDRVRSAKISDLEKLLVRNPRSRDVLYALAVMYRDNRDEVKAEEYMKKALEIDPKVGN
jgi:hypothetical protein